MATCGRKVRAAFVWLTALMTLAAGLPRFDCRCPDGQVKLFCTGQTSAACCCDNSCCSPTPTRGTTPQVAPADYCPRCGHEPTAPAGAAVGGASCVMTLAEAPDLSAGEARTAAEPESDVDTLAPISLGGIQATQPAQAPTCQAGLPPPPLDLVILLCHFII